jgi:hypothetical protein
MTLGRVTGGGFTMKIPDLRDQAAAGAAAGPYETRGQDGDRL